MARDERMAAKDGTLAVDGEASNNAKSGSDYSCCVAAPEPLDGGCLVGNYG